jgi:Ca-activated chloride channel family protein
MSFARPELALVALAACVLLAWLYRVLERRTAARALAYSNLSFALGAMRPSRIPGVLQFAVWVVGIAALGLSLAGPHFSAKVPSKDGTVVICIDTSGSMRAQDLDPSRGEAAKAAAHAFIDEVPSGTRVGIVTFSSAARLVQPPSSDLDAVRDAIERIPPPDGGTAIGDALALAAEQMPAQGKRIIVLLTDGVNNRGVDPVVTSQTIGARGISIYTIGVGTSGSGLIIPGTDELADLDENALRTIAANGNGSYASAHDSGQLQSVFRHLASTTVWERKRVDGSFATALAGGILVIIAFLAGFGAGRFP